MKQELIIGSIGTSLGVIGTTIQVDEVLKYVSLVITIIGALITYIVLPLLAWYKKSSADKKITTDELIEGAKTIKEGTEKVKEEVDKNNEK